jgi:hypothetical protein
MSEHVARLVEEGDAERLNICHALGLKDMRSLKEWILLEYGEVGATGDTVRKQLMSPPTL